MDWRVLAFTVIVSVLTGVLCGLFPAVEGSRADLSASLTETGARTGIGVRQRRARSLLVMAEMALTLVLVIGAALFIRTFAALRGVDPGFDPHSVLNVPMAVTGPRFQKTPALAQIVHEGERRLHGVPGVVSAGAACCMPMLGSYPLSFTIIGPSLNGPAHGLGAWVNISPGYFDVFKMPLIRGRAFTDRDNDASAGVVIINQVMARQFWPNSDPLSDRLLIGQGFAPAEEPARQIVGIVGNVRNGGLDGEPVPMMYVPMAQVPDALTALHSRSPILWFVRTAAESLALSAAIQTALHEASGAPVAKTLVRPDDELVVGTIAPAGFRMVLMTIFAGTALLLAAIGVYGVMAYSVQQRTPEIGIRLALGARSTQVRNMVLVQGMRMALIGVAMGLASAFGLAQVVTNLLFGVTARDPAVFIVVPVVLSIVAFLAVWVPAHRAARVDPMAALRHE
jgi:predicted permease